MRKSRISGTGHSLALGHLRDTVQKDPFLLNEGHDPRRRNQGTERATERGVGAAREDGWGGGRKSGLAGAVGRSQARDRRTQEAENAAARLCQSQGAQERRRRKEAAQKA